MMKPGQTLDDTLNALTGKYTEMCGDLGYDSFIDLLERARIFGNTQKLVDKVCEIIEFAGDLKVGHLNNYLSTMQFCVETNSNALTPRTEKPILNRNLTPAQIPSIPKNNHRRKIDAPYVAKVGDELSRVLDRYNIRVSENVQTIRSMY